MKQPGTQFLKIGGGKAWDEPEIPEGHTRLYRNTSGSRTGHYADRPLTGYGSDIWYSDVPSQDVENHRRGEHGTFLLTEESGVTFRKANLRFT